MKIGILLATFDALFCKESEGEIVKKIMNKVALELGYIQ
jgi:hypothetical protein